MSDGDKVTKLKGGHGTLTEHSDGRKTFETKFGTVKIDVDGSVITENENTVTETDEDGNSRTKIKNLKKVTIDDITKIASHSIDESDGAISHHIKFRDGGEYRMTYRKTGELIEARGSHLKTTITNDGQIILRSFDSSDED